MEGPIQVIKLLVRSFRRLRLFVCGFFKRQTAPLHAPQASLNPVESRAAPRYGLEYNMLVIHKEASIIKKVVNKKIIKRTR